MGILSVLWIGWIKGQVLPLPHCRTEVKSWLYCHGQDTAFGHFFKKLQLLLEKLRVFTTSGVFFDQFLPGLFRKIDTSLAFEVSQPGGVEDNKNTGSRSHNICAYGFQKGFRGFGLPGRGLRIYWMKNNNGFITALSRTELGRICKVVSNFLSTGQWEHLLILAGCGSRSASPSAIF